MFGFCSVAIRRNCCTARCCSIWYCFFKRLSPFFLAEKLTLGSLWPGVESRYFLRSTGQSLRWCGRGQWATAAPMPIKSACDSLSSEWRVAQLLLHSAKTRVPEQQT